VAVADLTADGRADIVVSSSADGCGRVEVFPGTDRE
jgi:hypothetical protein